MNVGKGDMVCRVTLTGHSIHALCDSYQGKLSHITREYIITIIFNFVTSVVQQLAWVNVVSRSHIQFKYLIRLGSMVNNSQFQVIAQ